MLRVDSKGTTGRWQKAEIGTKHLVFKQAQKAGICFLLLLPSTAFIV